MGKLPKCKNCKKEILDKSTTIFDEKKKSYYCNQECQNLSKISKQKNVDVNFKELMSYIDNLYEKNVNYPFINSQIKKLKEEHNFTTKGILLTLKYHQEILCKPFDKNYGLQGILTSYYNEAKKFYLKKQDIKKKVKEFNFSDNVVFVKKIEKELEFDDI